MKCSICGKNIETTILKKPRGTYIKNKKKRILVCSECQSGLKTRDKILEKVK
ncbi:hypothetical protein JW949_00495 [Candidatus Woesearchaeota archaeon]|jgi:hypothetical protein|nr:hypothetical protein [Candidatus Woesearchaeota archaeon]